MSTKSFKMFAVAAVMPLLALVYAQNAAKPPTALTPELRKQTVESLASAMKENYVFPELADKVDATLRERLKKGEYDRITTGPELATLLNEQINAICKDAHLRVRYFPE